MATADQKALIPTASEAGSKFVELYYPAYDKRRHKLSNLYMDNAMLVWNGHNVRTPVEIGKFLEALPTSQHVVEAFDAQPVSTEITAGQKTVLLTVNGSVRFDDKKQDKKMVPFNQNFVLTDCSPWKIVSDNFRFLE